MGLCVVGLMSENFRELLLQGGGVVKPGAEGFVEGGVEADYETRAIYLSGKASVVAAKDFETLSVYQLRLGFAPYAGEFDQINSWLIAQAQYIPSSKDEKLRVGPVMRVFYKTVLFELGVSAKGSWNTTFMVHW